MSSGERVWSSTAVQEQEPHVLQVESVSLTPAPGQRQECPMIRQSRCTPSTALTDESIADMIRLPSRLDTCGRQDLPGMSSMPGDNPFWARGILIRIVDRHFFLLGR